MDVTIVLKLISTYRARAAFRTHVSDGDRARDRRDWTGALASYRSALAAKPDYGISIQAAHCLKELRSYGDAFRLYAEAEATNPADDDLQLQLGHLEKVRGNNSAALARYRKALALNTGNDFARHEIAEMEGRLAVSLSPPTEIYAVDGGDDPDDKAASKNSDLQEAPSGSGPEVSPAALDHDRKDEPVSAVWIALSPGASFQDSAESRGFKARYDEVLSSLQKIR